MGTRVLRLVTLVLAGLVTGLAFAHVLEMPAKLGYDGTHYRFVQHTLYGWFAYVGGPAEVLAIVTAFALAYALRGTPGARAVLAGAVLLLAGLATWAAVVQTANEAMAAWTAAAPPPGWTTTRIQWELGHLAHFLVFGSGFGVLLWGAPNVPATRRPSPAGPVGSSGRGGGTGPRGRCR